MKKTTKRAPREAAGCDPKKHAWSAEPRFSTHDIKRYRCEKCGAWAYRARARRERPETPLTIYVRGFAWEQYLEKMLSAGTAESVP